MPQMPQIPNFPLARPVATPGTSNHEQQFRYMRRRVLLVSLALAVLLVVQPVISYIFDFAQLQSALEQFREVADLQSDRPKASHLFYMFTSGVPSLAFGIFIGLLVPVCGYLGVKNSSQSLVCAFCGCNCLSGCCSILGVMIGGLLLCGVMAGTAPLEHFLTRCDPSICMGNQTLSESIFDGKASQADLNRTVDCLAAAFPDYLPRYDVDGPKLPKECPSWVFLDWSSCEKDYDDVHDEFDATLKDAEWRSKGLRPRHEGFIQERAEAATAAPTPGSGTTSRRALRPWGKPHRGSKWGKPPVDPLEMGCAPNPSSIKAFHAAQELAPSLLPRLMLFIAVKMAFTLPVAILACLGFCWGNELYNRLNQGYSHMGDPGSMQFQNVPAPVYHQNPYQGQQQITPVMMQHPQPRMVQFQNMLPNGVSLGMPTSNAVSGAPVQVINPANPAAHGPE